MTPTEWAELTARKQGLPARVEDPVVLRKVAILVAAAKKGVEHATS